ncbi:YlbE-like family protein [Ectobacillus antri]|uniref:YlbE-like family protein n=1 Tax=Ectobacillus antri TaxID=2486280 RepID=A0ABT6H0M9_9BACI|nr:YlbE-like family protein [Ectobacillus antri]MDG4655810.1 YlbE-like family protein [Ectobacillus antri]MDG5752485.1 YlbE-like family protein [Ectobacillus antri]
MRKEIMDYVQSQEDLQKFIREQPYWYRKLSRSPDERDNFELAALQYYQKTIPDRVAKFQNQLAMASIMVDMFQYMKQQNGL